MRDIIHERDTKRTEIIVIADRSGSMSSTAADVIGGFNSFLAGQKKVEGEAKVTFIQFDNQYDVVYSGRPIAEAPDLDSKTFVPRGNTALLDAIGKTLITQGERIANERWADLVVVCIMTDGGENASKEHTYDSIKVLTKAAEDKGWTFVYLGANQDSFNVVRSFGISKGITANYVATGAGTRDAYMNMGATLSCLRTDVAPPKIDIPLSKRMDFTDLVASKQP